jgi:hypothetical protein
MGIGGKAHATRYKRADRAGKKVILDELCATTGWLALHFAYLPILIGVFNHLAPLANAKEDPSTPWTTPASVNDGGSSSTRSNLRSALPPHPPSRVVYPGWRRQVATVDVRPDIRDLHCNAIPRIRATDRLTVLAARHKTRIGPDLAAAAVFPADR